MKKTVNKKNQREIIFTYILDCIDGSGYDKQLTTDAEKIQFLLDTFRKRIRLSAEFKTLLKRTKHL